MFESRISKKPIFVPKEIEILIKKKFIRIQKKSKLLDIKIDSSVYLKIKKIGNKRYIYCKVYKLSKKSKELSGTLRSLIKNTITGLSRGFRKNLNLVGIGYKAEIKDKKIIFDLGFSHKINFSIPDDIEVKVIKNNKIEISGFNKQLVGDFSAKIRLIRKPEPYKGKGVCYEDEKIKLKETKKNKS